MKYHHLGLIQTLLSSSTTPFYFVVKAAEEEEAEQSVVLFDPNECGGGASSALFSSAEQQQSLQQQLPALYFTAIPDQADSTLCQRANAVRAYLENYISKTCHMNITVYNIVLLPPTKTLWMHLLTKLPILAGTVD